MQVSQSDLLQQVLLLTESMIVDAETSGWNALQQKELKRIEQLNKIDFNALNTISDIAPLLSQIISLNMRLEKLCENEKLKLAMPLKAIKRGKKMRKAIENLYLSQSGFPS